MHLQVFQPLADLFGPIPPYSFRTLADSQTTLHVPATYLCTSTRTYIGEYISIVSSQVCLRRRLDFAATSPSYNLTRVASSSPLDLPAFLVFVWQVSTEYFNGPVASAEARTPFPLRGSSFP